ncbi:MAG: hypothetical protein ACI4C7_02395 [Clostridia bacterium]
MISAQYTVILNPVGSVGALLYLAINIPLPIARSASDFIKMPSDCD